MSVNFQQLANFIWSVADLLRGPYRPPQYERVMLPLTVLRRFDAVLAPSKEAVLKRYEPLRAKNIPNIDAILNNLAKDEEGTPLGFHNHSPLDFQKLKGDPDNIGRHLSDYIDGFSENVRKIFERFEFDKEIEKLEESNRLYQVVSQFAEIDLHPKRVDNITMGLVFEDLIRRFNEAANETAGDHFTPREVIQLMVNLLLEPDTSVLTQSGVIVTICDPACGTGGMLAEAQNWIRAHNDQATVKVYGQDYNPRSYAVAASDLLIKGQKDSRVELGNTLIDDRFEDMHWFDYLLANPPFGVDWKAEKKVIDRWPSFRGQGPNGKIYRGKLPRINDGALLFLLHMISKFADYQPGNKDLPGSRAAIVFNGSPLFTGGAGSGESEIRRWIIEHDMLEAIVALPEQMFYNTGIGTFIWVVTNRKAAHRKGKIQLIDARERYTPMKRSLGDKRRYLDQAALDAVTCEHGKCSDITSWVRLDKDEKPQEWSSNRPKDEALEGQKWIERTTSRVFNDTDFGYRRITVLRPLRLRFQITEEARERFLNTCPELFDALQAVQDELGTEPLLDWNQAWATVHQVFKILPDDVEGWAKGAKGTAQKKIFRDCFATVDPDATPVIAKHHKADPLEDARYFPGQTLPTDLTTQGLYVLLGLHRDGKKGFVEYEPDPALKDAENIPLKEDIVSYFLREVRPYVADAWIDRETLDEQDGGIGKVGYEINFNRVFFQYQPPRPLHEIDAELAGVEQRILELLREVTE
ncbi:type I restriction enzyme M protein [Comamonas odontotermitis]|uniref:site-specific DNA-methyltransferase (adenine-specific) n=2 Tax=root TaxID=1 RepID=A0ABR6RIE4_9BURK|nr:class I SAM-dependent DNA methyltransferase [Comamonas odontotermitis]MBB6578931.1 type I restriction enzyme M protein [Comamonas odontotermitis]